METGHKLLMLEGPKFAGFDFYPASTITTSSSAAITTTASHAWQPKPKEPFVINGHRIILPEKKYDDQTDDEDQEAPLSHTANTAKSVWDCSIILSKYLEALSEQKPGFWTGKRVLELGAGQGIASFTAAALGAERVIITDVESAVPALEQGAALNGFSAPQVQVTALDWTDRRQAIENIWNVLATPPVAASQSQGQQINQQQHQPSSRALKLDYILASDVIWVDYLIPALVDTMNDLLQASKERRDSVFEEDHCQKPKQSPQDEQQSLSSSNCSSSTSNMPVVLLAYQFRSTRSDQILFNSLDQLGLNRRKINLNRYDYYNKQGVVDNNEDDDGDVFLDSKFRRQNLSIWKIWKS
ncbi:hypothetical protein BGZ49_003370 [Haplosporangium sp. Z 27]|nr:hypothetical protein BGZ49_003370 [Haplosporangium sp. Z 27]